jgi:hypothetical protein
VLRRPSVLSALPRTTRRACCALWLVVAFSIPGYAATTDSTEEVLETPADELDAGKDASTHSPPPPPIGVRYGEPLEGERFRVVYRFERIQRQGLLIGDRDVSHAYVIANSYQPYDRTPRSLTVTAHTFELSYSPHPRATLVVEVPFIQKELETLHDSGLRTQEQTRGVGDVGFALVVPFIRKGNESSHVHVGFDVPTGSIRRGGDAMRLPFDSQIGNGTVDLEWGWTYRGSMDWLSWGGQAVGRHPVGRNDLHYREGSRFEVSIWGATRIFNGLSASLRLAWEKQNNIRKFEAPQSITDPSDNSKARGGTYITLSPGITLGLPRLGNQRVAVEVGVPVYQHLSGPQLERDWSVKAEWQWGF